VNPKRIQTLELGKQDAGRDQVFGPRIAPGLQLIVIYTTKEGTLGALKAAGTLAKDLGGRVGLVATEVVPFRLPLDQPTISMDFLKWRQYALVSEAGLEGEEVRIQICLCRDRKRALAQLLAPRSLVVIGGGKGWRSRQERRLEKWLSCLGHRVIFVDLEANNCPRIVPKS
jgi:hypothetical protein